MSKPIIGVMPLWDDENDFYFCIDFSWDIYDRIRSKINKAIIQMIDI